MAVEWLARGRAWQYRVVGAVGKEPGQYLDGNAERWGGSCYMRGALESWKAEGFEDGFGRELDAWKWSDWRAGRHGSIECSGVGDGSWAIFG